MGNAKIAWEYKLTSELENLTSHSLELQVGLYFIGNPSLERITVRILRFPDLSRRKNEELPDYVQRTYEHIKKNEGAYIKDMVFWRSELNLDALWGEVKRIQQDIATFTSSGMNEFYKDRQSCSSPYSCSYLPLCELGVKDWHDSPVTEELYKVKEGRKDGIQSNLHNLREQRNWENDLSL